MDRGEEDLCTGAARLVSEEEEKERLALAKLTVRGEETEGGVFGTESELPRI